MVLLRLSTQVLDRTYQEVYAIWSCAQMVILNNM